MLLFGIGHKARQGKDSVGEYLAEKYGFNVYHYAAVLKREAQDAGWNPENKNELAAVVLSRTQDPELKQYLITCDRSILEAADKLSFLQWYGTEYRRNQDNNYWIKATFDTIIEDWKAQRPDLFRKDSSFGAYGLPYMMVRDEDWKVAICDMRFINEYLAVKARGGLTWDVRRETILKDTSIRVPYLDPSRDPYHPSETELDGIPHDFHITARDGDDLKDLHTQADNVMKFLQAGGRLYV